MSRKELRERAWQQMELLLDQEMPEKKRRRVGFYLPYAAAVTLFGVITATLFYQNQNNTQLTLNEKAPIQIELIEEGQTTPFFVVNKEKSIRKAAIRNNKLIVTNQTASLVVPTSTSKAERTFISIQPVAENKAITKSTSSIENKSVSADVKNDVSKTEETQETVEKNTIVAEKSEKNGFEKEALISNQKQQQVLFLTPEIRKSFQPGRDMGLTTNGSIGFVSENMEEYGVRMGLGLEKPIGKKFSANTAIRYSIYKDNYSSTYQTDTPEELLDQAHISKMNDRSVSRNFIEMPVYGTYNLTSNVSFKAGVSATYNKNKSESPGFSAQAVVNNSYLSEEMKQEIGKLYSDESGYLGEYLVGASLELDKISFDIEATRGFISNQSIDNRNIVGMRIGYKFGD